MLELINVKRIFRRAQRGLAIGVLGLLLGTFSAPVTSSAHTIHPPAPATRSAHATHATGSQHSVHPEDDGVGDSPVVG